MVALESTNQKYEGMVVEDFRILMVRGGQIDVSLMKKNENGCLHRLRKGILILTKVIV